MDLEENKYDPRLVTKLTRYNWTTEFKEAFLELALNYGGAGDIIITGQDIVIPDPGNYNDVANGVRRYPGKDILKAQRKQEEATFQTAGSHGKRSQRQSRMLTWHLTF
jgi:hypothetical protein